MAVYVVEYDPQWPKMYETERARILEATGNVLSATEHIGSTSVPGLAAKFVIDIMPGVQSLVEFDRHHKATFVEAMTKLGYEYGTQYEAIMPERRYFVRSGYNPLHPRGHIIHAHIVEIGSPFWVRHLAFREYLRAHPTERDAYGAFKMSLAPQHDDTGTYADAKHDFIQAMEASALAWYEGRQALSSTSASS